MNFDFLTGRKNPYLQEYQGYLVHQDIIEPLRSLQEQARAEIGAELAIISSFRDYDRQLKIFNAKALGDRPIYDDHNNIVNPKELSQEELLNAILRYSALPGASRHHWGCDIDVFDANKLKKEAVQLTSSECDEGGVFCELHLWLDEKIYHQDAFGFFRPYSFDLGGVACEKWHLSYAPLADEYFSEYSFEIFLENIHKSEFQLKDVLLKKPEEYFERYFLRITSA